MDLQPDAQLTENRWRLAFVLFSVFTFIILPLLSHAYGQTGDEWLQILYGQDIWNYFHNGDQQALGYDVLTKHPAGMLPQFKGQELYGGLFDYGTEILHRWLPKIPVLLLRHFCNALTSALLMVSTGLIARRLSGRWSVGFIALLFIFFSPRIFGEGMNNPKDIPFAAGFALATYGALALMQDGRKRWFIHSLLLALGFGLAFGVRAAGGLLFFAYLAVIALGYFFLDKDWRANVWDNRQTRIRLIMALTASIIAGYIIGLIFWPWGLQSPISHPLISLEGMTNRETMIRTLFDGEFVLNAEAPANYEFKWILISSPVVVIIGAFLFVVMLFRSRKMPGLFPVLFILFAALFPLLYMIYKHSSVYDTWRHVFFVYPFWVVAAAIGWWMAGSFILARIKRKSDLFGKPLSWVYLPIVLLSPAIIWTLRSHPNQYVYFNEFAGGIKEAAGSYETDYYYNSSAQDVQWILKDIPRVPGKKSIVLTNMGGFSANCFLGDTAFVTSDYCRASSLNTRDWDYYILFPRLIPDELILNGTWVPQGAAFTASAGGVPLSVVLKKSRPQEATAIPPAGK